MVEQSGASGTELFGTKQSIRELARETRWSVDGCRYAATGAHAMLRDGVEWNEHAWWRVRVTRHVGIPPRGVAQHDDTLTCTLGTNAVARSMHVCGGVLQLSDRIHP